MLPSSKFDAVQGLLLPHTDHTTTPARSTSTKRLQVCRLLDLSYDWPAHLIISAAWLLYLIIIPDYYTCSMIGQRIVLYLRHDYYTWLLYLSCDWPAHLYLYIYIFTSIVFLSAESLISICKFNHITMCCPQRGKDMNNTEKCLAMNSLISTL